MVHHSFALAILLFSLMMCQAQSPAKNSIPNKAREILDKAIRAHGGSEELEKLTTASWRGRGLLYRNDQADKPVPFFGEWHGVLPDQYRYTYSFKGTGGNLPVTTGFHDGKSWRTLATGRGADDLVEKLAKEVAEEAHAHYVSRLTPLLGGQYQLTTLPVAKRDERFILGLKADRLGYRSVYLFFDRQLGFLTFIDRKVFDAEKNEDLLQETSFLNFKSFGKATLPQSITIRKGKKLVMELELDKYEPKTEFAKKFFEKPPEPEEK